MEESTQSPNQDLGFSEFVPAVPPRTSLIDFAARMEMAGDSAIQGIHPAEIFWTGLAPSDVRLLARRDGFVIFRFQDSPDYAGGSVPGYQPVSGVRWPATYEKAKDERQSLAYKRFGYMNAFLTAFNSGMSQIQKTGGGAQSPMNPLNYYLAVPSSEQWIVVHPGSPAPVSNNVKNISVETLEYAVSVLIASHRTFGSKGIRPLSLIHIACNQYSMHQFETAHLLAWSVIEMQLQLMWENHLDELSAGDSPQTSINAKRRKLLTGRDYTASILSQMLSLSGKLNDNMLEALDLARVKRNNFAHSLGDVTMDDAGRALRTATDLLSMTLGINVASPLSVGFQI